MTSRFATGDTVDGRYRITGPLGAGAMGLVMCADDVFLRRRVALKLLDPRIEDEARALASVRHENVVQVYAFGIHDDVPFFAMEYVDGDTLQDRIDADLATGVSPDPRTAVAIVRAVARGLDAVHARGLVHRDVKPSNIVLEHGSDRPVLVDFGLAHRSEDGAIATGGTPAYMAPEQVVDHDGQATCAASDLYALACTAFELLTGRSVFDADDLEMLLRAHLEAPPPRASSLRPSLAAFDGVFARALAKRPADRHPSCTAFADELDAAAVRAATRTLAPPRRSQVRSGRRVIVLAKDEKLARQLVRVAERALPDAHAHDVASVGDVLAALDRRVAEAVIVDEEAVDDGLPAIVARAGAERVVLLSRDWTAKRTTGIRVVAKPVNGAVLASVLGAVAVSSTRACSGSSCPTT